MEYKELPPDKRKLPCLEDREVIELTKIAKKVEAHFGCPQDIEYSISGSLPFPESIFLVQARPETVWGKKKRNRCWGRRAGWNSCLKRLLPQQK